MENKDKHLQTQRDVRRSKENTKHIIGSVEETVNLLDDNKTDRQYKTEKFSNEKAKGCRKQKSKDNQYDISMATSSASNVVSKYSDSKFQETTSQEETVSLVFDCYFEGDMLYFVEDKNQQSNNTQKQKNIPKIDKQKLSTRVKHLRNAKSKKRAHEEVDLTGESDKQTKLKKVRVSFPSNKNKRKRTYSEEAQLYAPYTSNVTHKKQDCEVIVLSDDEIEPDIELLSSDDETYGHSSFLSLQQEQLKHYSPVNKSTSTSTDSISTTLPNPTNMKLPQHPSERNKKQIFFNNDQSLAIDSASKTNEHVNSNELGHSDELIGETKVNTSDRSDSTDPVTVLIDIMDNEQSGDDSTKAISFSENNDKSNLTTESSSNNDDTTKSLSSKDSSESPSNESSNKIENKLKDPINVSIDSTKSCSHEKLKNVVATSDKELDKVTRDSKEFSNNESSNEPLAVLIEEYEKLDTTHDKINKTDISKDTTPLIQANECTNKGALASNDSTTGKESDKICKSVSNKEEPVNQATSKPINDSHLTQVGCNKKKRERFSHMVMSTSSFLNSFLSESSHTSNEISNAQNITTAQVEKETLGCDSENHINEEKRDILQHLDSIATIEGTNSNKMMSNSKSYEMDLGEQSNVENISKEELNISLSQEKTLDVTTRLSYENLDKPVCVAGSILEFNCKCENYLRDCKWSPDGECILTNSNDNVLRTFSLPENIQDQNIYFEMSPTLRMSEGETIYSMDWYPYMNVNYPDFCCFLSTSRDHPVHLWDSLKGKVRCSYRAYDQMDELTSAKSVAFNLDGSKIYCGFNKMLRIFDSNRPGRECMEISTVAAKRKQKGKRAKQFSQTGIISSIAFSTDQNGIYALGSYTKTVGLYATNTNEDIALLTGHKGGVTQVKFTSDGFYLFSGGRKDPEIICWDLRDTSRPLFQMSRNVSTNQTIHFDVNLTGSHIVSGDTDNNINVWNLDEIFPMIGEDVVCYEPKYKFKAHHDVVNAVSIHPTQALLASTSGQRHFILDDSESDDNENTSNTKKQNSIDNCMKIWKL